MNATLSLLADRVRASLDFRDVATRYGLDVNSKGFAPCPFHSEKTASFRVQNARYGHCFGCGWNGDIIKFTCELFNLRFMDALVKLNGDFNLNLPVGHRLTLAEQREADRAAKRLMEEKAAENARREAYETSKQNLIAEYVRLTRLIDLLRPTSPEDAVDPRFISALRWLPEVEYALDCLPPTYNYTL